MTVKKAAVIGAGVMGSGIAAHLANAGIPVMLLDIVPDGAADRSTLARGAIQRMLKTDPAPFMSKKVARLVTPGNTEDDLQSLSDCDWIVEAVVEDPAVKADLYARLEPVIKPEAVVSSNTSTIPLSILTRGRSDAFKASFMVTHFFNPPRYMRLLEVVSAPETDAAKVAMIRDVGDRRLGKGVVTCKDTPGFIANRIGTFWIQVAINEAIDLGLTVEQADQIVGRPMGVPKTGVFGLVDLVGLDLMPKIAQSLLTTLPANDAYRAIYRVDPVIERLIADGYTGRKGKGGFYRLERSGPEKVKESVDLRTGEFSPSTKPRIEAVEATKATGLAGLVAHDSVEGQYAWRVLAQTLSYAAGLVPEISDTIHGVDEAMRLGYAWKWGPFELADMIGADTLAARLEAEGFAVPPLLELARAEGFYKTVDGILHALHPDGGYRPVPRAEGVLWLDDIKRTSKPLLKNGSACLWDLGDGVTGFEVTTKMNALDDQVMDLLGKSIALTGRDYKAMVLYSDGTNFSVGANLGLALFVINVALWDQVEQLVEGGQKAYQAMKYAPFPVVGAPAGLALGGGCEMLLHCDAVQAAGESYIGLVETGVGLVPGWGGCKEMLLRHMVNPKRPNGPMPPIQSVFETLGTAKVAKSAMEAQELGFLRPTDGITMNRDRVLADAKARALAMVQAGYTPPSPPEEIRLPGPTARTGMKIAVDQMALAGVATPHDRVVADALARVLSGGDTDITETLDEDAILALERAAFMEMVRHPATIARIEHMLETNKPLRN
ncbi:3-hydroxyacyl-CoA dehydrogenase NAD-binding domain-containing protein [Fodinicurvata sp. EGI_FJ10296]|uniref:3-hydroxyacyl-CoA dehydrogenase/enoyl-CoA hydratase family protein n=1 Tax=Fodinicurvata sp. EGI_FJ10296 TaxID=3231908 RepID=UPI00345383DF